MPKNIPLEDRVDILARTLGDVERRVALMEHQAKMDALEEQVRSLSNRIARMERSIKLAEDWAAYRVEKDALMAGQNGR